VSDVGLARGVQGVSLLKESLLDAERRLEDARVYGFDENYDDQVHGGKARCSASLWIHGKARCSANLWIHSVIHG
jgi:hypothetical protein